MCVGNKMPPMIQPCPLPPSHHSLPAVQWAKPRSNQSRAAQLVLVAQAHCRHTSCHRAVPQLHTWATLLAPSGTDSVHQLHPPEQGEPLENTVCVEGGIKCIHQKVYHIKGISLLSPQAHGWDLPCSLPKYLRSNTECLSPSLDKKTPPTTNKHLNHIFTKKRTFVEDTQAQ